MRAACAWRYAFPYAGARMRVSNARRALLQALYEHYTADSGGAGVSDAQLLYFASDFGVVPARVPAADLLAIAHRVRAT